MAPLIKKKDKHSTGRLGQGQEQEIHKSNKSRDNYVCILTVWQKVRYCQAADTILKSTLQQSKIGIILRLLHR